MLIKTHERVLVRSSQEERGDERNKFTARLQEPACRLPTYGLWTADSRCYTPTTTGFPFCSAQIPSQWLREASIMLRHVVAQP
ncbi:hypothetical protein CDV31_011397 [Fusarium ambrosium]|uniref:Uncharacterized protein n=1 Tax=Fusarium ambrosium TaxID=131363 RepID=A0A428TH70_9HYPO|nr:hypothetical protein CDV31_011397 [Fusarium ambrosium]